MSFDIEIYRGPDNDHYGDYELLDDVLRLVAIRHFGDKAKGTDLHLALEEPADPEPYAGPPEVRNIAKFGHCRLRLIRDGRTVREDRIRAVELLGPVLADQLRDLEPDETRWSFVLRQRQVVAILVTPEALEGLVGRIRVGLREAAADERPAPVAVGAVEVDLSRPRHQPFTMTPVAAADAELVRPEDLGLDPARLRTLNVLMAPQVRTQMLRDMELSDRIEEGGFLLGRVRRAAVDSGEPYLVEVTHVTPAHRSGAGRIHFTFTGESFLDVARLIGERGQEEELVGWYHTHGHGVSVEMGLSSIDVDLHLATFRRPWQVAALINLRRTGRLLRFYGRGTAPGANPDDRQALVEYDQWIGDDGGGYRSAGYVVGGE